MTAPLTPPDCDLRGMLFMPIEVARLRDSDLALVATGDEFKAAVLLWCASWHQVPAGSLPNENRALARLSGLTERAWSKAKAGALRGWVECDDGRLYHAVVSERVLHAWAERTKYRKKRDDDRERLKEWRERKQDGNSDGNADETRFSEGTKRLRREGEGEGEEKDSSVPNGTGAVAPIDPDKKAWREGVDLLKSHGVDDKPARQFIGKLVKDSGAEPRALLPIIAKCIEIGTQDPQSYLRKAVQGLADRRAGGSAAPADADEPINWAMRLEFWRKDRTWLGAWGPTPNEPKCQCPAEMLEA